MAANAQTLETNTVALGSQGLSDRGLLLCLLAVYAGGATAQSLVASAKAQGYGSLSDQMLTEALLAVLS